MNDFNFDNPQRWTLVPASSNILAIQYTAGDPLADLGTLRIRFHSGAEYSYDKVPNQLAVDFFESESKGKFFHANISRVYEGVRNTDDEADSGLLAEDVPISELANEVKIDEPILPTPYRERA